MGSQRRFDGWSLLVMAVTLVLFLIAPVTIGSTHDLLVDAGVFLVSVKLILVGYKMSASNDAIQRRLEEIYSAIRQPED